MADVIVKPSKINYSYATIRITQSRIDKGLIAIPVALAKWFPMKNDSIQVYLNDSPAAQTKRYSSYDSSTHECRIGGIKQWFQQNKIKKGDEIVIQLVDKELFIYRLIPERNFILKTKELQNSFDNSGTEQEASKEITTLAQWTYLDKGKVVLNEYQRLLNTPQYEGRRYIKKYSSRTKENTPTNIRILLEEIYRGHCQICDFWFLKRDKRPFFEIHHLNPLKGHHPQNLLVVCGNCHNQFEYADVKQTYNGDGWLFRLSFNKNIYSVKQNALITKREVFSKETFI